MVTTAKSTFASIKKKEPGGLPDVRVCDFPMGGGKTQSLIRELNKRSVEDADFRAIVLLSRKSEDERIRDDCPALDFVIPDRGRDDWRPVVEQTAEYMSQGRNIASTHAALDYYRDDIYELARSENYSLYIDESISAIDIDKNSVGDIQFLIDDGTVGRNSKGEFIILNEDAVNNYKGKGLRGVFRTLQSRGIAEMDTDLSPSGIHSTVLWRVSPELFTSFQDVTIITFNFRGQQFYYYLEAENIPYRWIGVGKDGDGINDFYFTDNPDEYYIPPYLSKLDSLVHVYETDKMMSQDYFGKDRTALSMNWYKRGNNISKVSNMADSFFRHAAQNLTDDYGASRRMWSVFKEDVQKMVKGKTRLGRNSFLSYSTRAVNDYSDRTILVYAVNLFPNVAEANYWHERGFELDKDLFALNHMIQWIWRSAIRNGKEIWVLVPSNRMRDLLKDWLKDPLQYCQVS